MMVIEHRIPSDVLNNNPFITFCVLFGAYPSWGSKFTAWSPASGYTIHSFIIIHFNLFQILSFSSSLPNNSRHFPAVFIAKYFMGRQYNTYLHKAKSTEKLRERVDGDFERRWEWMGSINRKMSWFPEFWTPWMLCTGKHMESYEGFKMMAIGYNI